jgi:acylphosphatase
MPALRLRIIGRVQGVGYRAFVADEGQRLGLTGWVRNRADGSVEAVVVGNDDAVAAMLAACRRGPRFSAVERIEQEACDEAGFAGGFEIRPTL